VKTVRFGAGKRNVDEREAGTSAIKITLNCAKPVPMTSQRTSINTNSNLDFISGYL
jgi:hypothetical protein